MTWVRHSCVYCAKPTRERHPLDQRRRLSPLACWRHADLIAYDPVYADVRGEKRGG